MVSPKLLLLPCGAAALAWSQVERLEVDAGSFSATFLSEDLPMRPGEFVFTDTDETPVGVPTDIGPYAITGFSGELVDDMNKSVPLNEVYDHHWVVMHDDFSNPLCKHGPQYAFGIGAESRRTSVKFPKGYGYRRSNPYEYWGANIHLLRTEHLRGEPRRAVKECNECYYAPGKGCAPRDNGTFACCGDYGESGPLRGKLHSQSQTSSKKLPSAAGSTTTTTTAGGELLSSSSSSLEKARDFLDRASYYGCPVEPGSPLDVKTYRLKYTINYTDYLAVKPAEIGVWTTPDCDTFYGVYENDAEPESLSSTTFDVEDDMEILTMIGHQHVGALNISVFVNDDFLCASTPKYGLTEGLAGDERGYLVEMSACFLKDDDDPDVPDVVLRKGDKLRLDSWYWVGSVDPNLSGHPGGSHLNVMGYMYTIFNRL